MSPQIMEEPNRFRNPLYRRVDARTREAFFHFREQYAPSHLNVEGVCWEYLAVGEGRQALLLLHGMAGAYDIWWQQIEAFKDRYRVVSVTYPDLDRLEDLAEGLSAILDHEGSLAVNVVGTSLGGYLAQYYVGDAPERIERAVFANTFPPNDVIQRRTGWIEPFFPIVPAGWIAFLSRVNTRLNLYPASGGSELLRAYLLESSVGAMDKQAFIARYRCVVEHFPAPDMEALGIPLMIIEVEEDPLISEHLQQRMRSIYPTGVVCTMRALGHFPYLSAPGRYNNLLATFLEE
jgi:pimeloyl-ACP methyl ester carboxylesterase